MADSAARVRVFSDDGKCVVHDPLLMRRALEYVKAFDGVVAQHAEEPRLTAGAQMNEGVVAARLGLAGWPAVGRGGDHRPRRAAGRARRLPAARLPRLDRGLGGDPALGQGARASGSPPRSPRTTCCSPTSWPRATTRSTRSTRRCARPRTSRRCGPALADGTIDAVATDHAPHALEDKETEWAAARPGMLGLETALSVVRADDGRDRAARLARAWPTGCRSAPAADRRAGRARPPLAEGAPATSRWSTRPHGGRRRPGRARPRRSRNTPYAGRELPGRVVATFLRGEPTVLDGKAVR